jgi:CRP-like cAMP-binding protein
MILPGIRLWYEGRSRELEEVLLEAENFHLTGYARCSFPTVQDFIILERGRVTDVIEIGPNNRPVSKNLRALWGKSKIKDGILLVYEIPPAIDHYLHRLNGRRQVIGKGSSSRELKELIIRSRLEKESRVIDVSTPEGKGLVIFENGAISSCCFTDSAGFTFSELDAFKRMYRSLQEGSAYQAFQSGLADRRVNGTPWMPILLGGLDRSAPVVQLKKHMTEKFGRWYSADTVLFREGEKGGEIYQIVKGRVSIYREKEDFRNILAELGPGEIFGEMAFFNRASRSSTAATTEDSLLIKLNRDDFQTLLYNSCDFRISIIKKLVERLRSTSGEIARYWEEPRTTYLEKIIFQVINSDRKWLEEGIPPGLLMQEISSMSKMRFSEIDGLFRKLLENGKIDFIRGRVVMKEHSHLP